jgi:hypothetical protein
MKLAVGRSVSEDKTPAIRRGFFLLGTRPGDRVTAQGNAKPAAAEALQLRRRRGGVIEGERTGAKKTGQRDRTRRNWDALGKRRIGCRKSAGAY